MLTEPEGDRLVPPEPGGPGLRATAFTTVYGAMLRPIHSVGWSRIRVVAYVVYAAVVAWTVAENGIPTDREKLAIIIVSGLGLTSVGQGWRRAARVVLDWLPFTVVLMLYDRTRAVADAIGLPLHEQDVLDAERWVFGGVEPSLWLQQHLYDPGVVHWYDVAVTLVYSSHFLATPVLAAALWLRDRSLWLGYISRVIVLSLAGLITYCLFPEAPPWYASEDGLTGPIARLSARGWIPLHLGNVQETLESAQRDGANAVAAMPSLHTAFATLVAIVAVTHLRTRWRWLALLYPLAMAYTLVYCGEHYVLDLLAGVVYAIGVHLVLNRWDRHRRNRSVGAGVPADPFAGGIGPAPRAGTAGRPAAVGEAKPTVG